MMSSPRFGDRCITGWRARMHPLDPAGRRMADGRMGQL